MTEKTPTPPLATLAVNGHTPSSTKANGSTHLNGSANGSATNETPTGPTSDTPSPRHTDSQQPSGTSEADRKPVKAKRRPPGGFDPTKLPAAPKGYTLRFTFHSASNLAPADINTASSDPFLHATLKVAGLKRHKEDPDLTHRTPTLRNTLEPQWNDTWVVANVPPTGFTLKCRLYDEDSPDKDDRLGNVTVKVPRLFDEWEGIPLPGRTFGGKKRVMSKRAYVFKAVTDAFHAGSHMTPLVTISVEMLGPSEPPHGQVYTVGPASWVQHFSPMIGRLAGTKVDDKEDGEADGEPVQAESSRSSKPASKPKNQRYEFRANEMQLAGPIPPSLYHRFVAFRPIIGSMFMSTGIRGKILNKALHKQHNRIYNYDSSTEHGSFDACSDAATRQFLKMAHYDQGGRVFTYVLTLDSLFRFTETGKEFGIDLLSKHTMHSNVETYIAYSGEFFIRRLEQPTASDDIDPKGKTHPDDPLPGGPPDDKPPQDPSYYQLVIDNDSGTYRPEKDVLPDLKAFFERNFPGLGVVTMHWEDEELQASKDAQHSAKKKEGEVMRGVLNRSMSSISSAESELDDRQENWDATKSKRERAWEALEQPGSVKHKAKQALH